MKNKKSGKKKTKVILLFSILFIYIHNIYGLNEYIYIIDTGNNRAQKFDMNWNFLITFGTKGIEEGQFYYPASIAISSDTNLIYIADTVNNRIQVFDSQGNFKKIFITQSLSNPNGIIVNYEQGQDFIYIADTGNNRILKYSYSGEFIYELGKKQASNKDGEFNNPQGIAADENFIFISDTGNHKIQKFDLNGNFITKWGTYGNAQGQFNYPRDLAIDGQKNIYVVDSQNYRIQKFTSNGDFVLAWGCKGNANGEFNSHFGVSVDKENFIYVADAGNNRIQKFDSSGNHLITYGTLTKSAEPGLFYYPQAVEISFLKIFTTETPTFTLTETETFTDTQTFTMTETFTSVITATHTETIIQSSPELSTPTILATSSENPDEKCEFKKVYEIKWNFFIPRCITMDEKENIYILDFMNKWILKFNRKGFFIKRIYVNNTVVKEESYSDETENVYYEMEIKDSKNNKEELKKGIDNKIIDEENNGNNIFFNVYNYKEKEIKKYDFKGVCVEKIKMANDYKGDIKNLLNLKDDTGVIYAIDKYNKRIYREYNQQRELLNFNLNKHSRYIFFIKNNNFYIAEITKKKIIIYKFTCFAYKNKYKYEQDASDLNYKILSTKDNNYIKKDYNDLEEKDVYNYPNPFKDKTTIRFITGFKQDIILIIYDINGKIVYQRKISANDVRTGLNEIIFDCKNEYNIALSNGVYFYKIIGKNKAVTKKLVIMK